ncbi:hypothetical protein EYF80_040762 [Liparis tanakae]|uniref:Uncharacterized protein n=1 Tax=Liparis tanakae TaxID=230148 RepID=A0A4Z2G8B6_9TELE|nr:hypothetical protein EYF80_040762 [Liparis tanakae]
MLRRDAESGMLPAIDTTRLNTQETRRHLTQQLDHQRKASRRSPVHRDRDRDRDLSSRLLTVSSQQTQHNAGRTAPSRGAKRY